MIVKKTIIGIACCALVAPLAFGKSSRAVTFENGSYRERSGTGQQQLYCQAASYQASKILLFYNEGSGHYVLDGRGHVFDSTGPKSPKKESGPGAHVQV